MLCGIVSGVSFGSTYAASMWPLLMNVCSPRGTLEGPNVIWELFDTLGSPIKSG